MPANSASTRLGLLSDTHGDAIAAATAIRLLSEANATTLIHLGDVGSEAVLEELVSFDRGDVHLVFGNCDDAFRLARHAERLGLRSHHPAGMLEFDGKRVAFSHGHLIDPRASEAIERLLSLLEDAPDDGRIDYLLHGHTHRQRDEMIDRAPSPTRIINPGALHRANPLTVALLEPATGRLESMIVVPTTREATSR